DGRKLLGADEVIFETLEAHLVVLVADELVGSRAYRVTTQLLRSALALDDRGRVDDADKGEGFDSRRSHGLEVYAYRVAVEHVHAVDPLQRAGSGQAGAGAYHPVECGRHVSGRHLLAVV